MTEQNSHLLLLKNKLHATKDELIEAQKQLNKTIAELELAEAKAKQGAAANPLTRMAREHILQVGYTLLVLNKGLCQIDIELNQAKKSIDQRLAAFEQFSRNAYHVLQKSSRTCHDKVEWKKSIAKLQQLLQIHLMNWPTELVQVEDALNKLVSDKNQKLSKMSCFRSHLQWHLNELLDAKALQSESPLVVMLERERAQLLLQKAGHIREIQRYNHIIDNIVAMESNDAVKPLRFKKDQAERLLHSMMQQKSALIFEIRLIENPERAVNDVLIEIDDLPEKKNRANGTSQP